MISHIIQCISTSSKEMYLSTQFILFFKTRKYIIERKESSRGGVLAYGLDASMRVSEDRNRCSSLLASLKEYRVAPKGHTLTDAPEGWKTSYALRSPP